MLKVNLISDKKTWDQFVTEQVFYTFFQSWDWGEFCKKTGEEIFRYGIFDDKNLIGVSFINKVSAKRGTFLFCPHGPLFKENKPEYWEFFLNFFKELGIKKKVSFVRISPILEKTVENIEIFRSTKFIDSPIHMTAENSWILKINDKSADQLLSEMRKTTRYEIRKAEKNLSPNGNYKVIKSKKIKDLDIFLELYHSTVERAHFIPFSDSYIKKEFMSFSLSNNAVLFLEKHGKDFVAALMVIFYGKGAYYHQGATSPKGNETVSYLAQWEAIKEAQRRGCDYYNFWGVAPAQDRKHPWSGLSLFKKGFGGAQMDFVHAQDYPINKVKYLLTFMVETFRRFKRGL